MHFNIFLLNIKPKLLSYQAIYLATYYKTMVRLPASLSCMIMWNTIYCSIYFFIVGIFIVLRDVFTLYSFSINKILNIHLNVHISKDSMFLQYFCSKVQPSLL